MFSGSCLIISYTSMLKLLHRYQASVPDGARFAADVDAHNLGVSGALTVAIIALALGLFCLLKGAYDNSPARHPTTTPTAESEPN